MPTWQQMNAALQGWFSDEPPAPKPKPKPKPYPQPKPMPINAVLSSYVEGKK